METLNRKKSIVLCLLLVGLAVASVSANECDNWQTLHPEWIFCDDFEDGTALVRDGRYFEHQNDDGEFIIIDGVGVDGSKGMRVLFQAGEVGAGNLNLAFGRNPNDYMNNGIRETEDFREIYYRMYLKMQPGWVGSPAKLSRATSFSSATSWAQAMIAHLWSSGDYLLVDPASGVENGVVVTTKYNDFANLHWLGYQAGVTPIFDSQHDGIWYGIEHHIKLNDPGHSNGVQEFWIDGYLEARRDGLNFVDTWTDYAINAVFFENYWNSGSPQLQVRYFDNIVVSTQQIDVPAVHGGELIAHWNFDEGQGDTAYDSAGANHGTLVNGPVWTTGQIGGALNFDGIDDYVATALNIDQTGSTDVTMSAWVYPTSLKEDIQQIISTDNGGHDWSLLIRNGKWQVFPGYYSMVTEFNIELNVWQHVTAVFDTDDDKVYFYKNGVRSSVTSELFTDTSTNHLCIGDNPGLWNEYFEGKIDEVRIYNRDLSSEEVEELYHGQLLSLEVVGPNVVAENFQAQYKAIANYERADVDVTGSTVWSVEPNDIADIDAGLLETEEIDKPQNITITAEYTEGEVAVEAEKAVSIFTICPSGTALDFDGENDYVDTTDFSLGEEFTVSMWVNQSNTNYGQCFIGKHLSDGGNILLIGFWSGGYHVRIRADTYTSGTPTVGWQHIAVIVKQMSSSTSDLTFFKDGGILWSRTLNAVVGNMLGLPWTIGQDWDTGLYRTDFFNGMIDEVAIYNRALSAEEIQAIMHTKLTGDEDGLVAYWDFDEGDGEIAGDSSGNGNDGAIVGAEWIQSDAPVGICIPVAVDIKPGSCPNPLNLSSQGVLPVAVLGTEDFDVYMIDAISIRLAGVAAIRHSYEDVAAPVTDGNECECTTEGPDGYTDLTLKFGTQEIVEQLIYSQDELAKDQTLPLTLTGQLFDDIGIEGTDCIRLVGNVPKWLAARRWDANGDGVVNMADFAIFAENWLVGVE